MSRREIPQLIAASQRKYRSLSLAWWPLTMHRTLMMVLGALAGALCMSILLTFTGALCSRRCISFDYRIPHLWAVENGTKIWGESRHAIPWYAAKHTFLLVRGLQFDFSFHLNFLFSDWMLWAGPVYSPRDPSESSLRRLLAEKDSTSWLNVPIVKHNSQVRIIPRLLQTVVSKSSDTQNGYALPSTARQCTRFFYFIDYSSLSLLCPVSLLSCYQHL